MRGPVRSLLLSLSLLASSGCALAAKSSRSDVDRARDERARALDVERRAPLPLGRSREAQRAVRESPEDSAERRDHELTARLWLDVAIAEAERQVSSEQRLERERALVELDARLVTLESERADLARENELAGARSVAQLEARRALARAAQRPDLRVRMGREESKRAAEALLARAELIALALRSFEHEGAALGRLDEKLKETRALLAKQPEASLAPADETLFFALSLLANVRQGASAASDEEKAALAEELTLAGFQVRRGDRGMMALLEPAFSKGGPLPETGRLLERLCAIAKAHPVGPVQLAVRAAEGALGEARVAFARERLAREQCSGERFLVARAAGDDHGLEASFLAY